MTKMYSQTFNFTTAFQEVNESIYGVWVGEHGFLVAVFGDKDKAEKWASENYSDYGVDEISLEEPKNNA